MDIDNEEFDIPLWQMDEVKERMAGYKKNPDLALDFDKTMDEIEKEL
jgi:hypothetical protein